MSRNCEKLVSLNSAFIGIALILLFASSASAQSGLTRPLESERDRQQRRVDQIYRPPDTQFKRAKYITGGGERRLPGAAHVKGHSARIQFLNRALMRSVSTTATLDYKAVAKSANEIRKYAVELRQYLGLAREDDAVISKQGWNQLNDQEVRAALLRLDNVIKSFGQNPLLDSRGVLEAAQAASAGRDLEEIIVLSDKIRRSAKRLNRTARKTRSSAFGQRPDGA
jgi:hypothetical protein